MGCPAHTPIAHRPGESFALVQPLDPLPEGIDLLLQGVEPRLQGQFDPGDVAPRNRAGFNFWISGPKKANVWGRLRVVSDDVSDKRRKKPAKKKAV